MPQRRLGRVVLSRGPWRVMRPTTRPSSLGPLPCKPLAAVRSGFSNCHVPGSSCAFCARQLLWEFVDREARLVTLALRQDLQVLVSERRARWSVYGSFSPDGEETANFFDACPDIARCLGIRPSTAKYKAIAKMSDLLQALYCTYQGPTPLNCGAMARDLRRHCTARTASWYLPSLEHAVNTMLQNIKPFGLAMFSGDISESINRFLKHSHNEHNNRGGGGGAVGWRGWTRCRVVSGRPSKWRPMCKHNA